MSHMKQVVHVIPKYFTIRTTRTLCKAVHIPTENRTRKKCGCGKQEKESQSPGGKMRLQELIRRLQEENKDSPRPWDRRN